jgi:hypothetical protein
MESGYASILLNIETEKPILFLFLNGIWEPCTCRDVGGEREGLSGSGHGGAGGVGWARGLHGVVMVGLKLQGPVSRGVQTRLQNLHFLCQDYRLLNLSLN